MTSPSWTGRAHGAGHVAAVAGDADIAAGLHGLRPAKAGGEGLGGQQDQEMQRIAAATSRCGDVQAVATNPSETPALPRSPVYSYRRCGRQGGSDAGCSGAVSPHWSRSHVQIVRELGVLLDELEAQLRLAAHQAFDQVRGLARLAALFLVVAVRHAHPEQRALGAGPWWFP